MATPGETSGGADGWSAERLQALVDAGITESKDIEYKRDAPGGADKDKRELAADLSSLANSVGGILIFGIEAEEGVPRDVLGLKERSPDRLKLWVDEVAQRWIEPRIPGLRIDDVTIADGRYCLVIQVPMSWMKPHAVKVNDGLRFYSRNSAGKYLLDFQEIRELFVGSEAATERLTHFRAERVMRIESGNTPVPLTNRPKVVLHLVPLQAFSSRAQVEVREFQWQSRVGQLQTIAGGMDSWRYNLDGLVTYLEEGEGLAMSYVQVFRNGTIEAADSYCVSGRMGHEEVIPSSAFEKKLVSVMPALFESLKFMKLDPPAVVLMSLIGVKGMQMGLRHGLSRPIDDDVLLLPEQLIESYPSDGAPVMKPLIDMVWNACGLEKSPNFDIEGKYYGK
jgi:hypothetical protein